jgi:hypothetical protein
MAVSRCESCGRRGKPVRGAGDATRCEFCGGRLRISWGLAQLAQRARTDRRDATPQLHESQVREALYGRPGSPVPKTGGDGDGDGGGGREGQTSGA